MTRQSIIAAAVGGAGWLATLSFNSAAAGFAALATGFWMLTQAYFMIRRERCTVRDCRRRKL